MKFDALKIPIDPTLKQASLVSVTRAIEQTEIVASVKLDMVAVILNQARYLNHLTYALYILVLLIEWMVSTSAGKIEMMIYLGMVCTIFPLIAALECADAKRADLIALHRTYPFDYGLLVAIRFLYLTILNSGVLLVCIIGVNALRHFDLIDGISAITLICSMLSLSASSLLIRLKIKKGSVGLLINFLINALVQFSLVSLLTMVETMHGLIQISWCIGWIVLALVCMGLTVSKVKKGVRYGSFGA